MAARHPSLIQAIAYACRNAEEGAAILLKSHRLRSPRLYRASFTLSYRAGMSHQR